MATKRQSPTLTRPWRSVTEIRDGLEKARKFSEQHTLLLGEQYSKIRARREQLEGNLSDLSPSERANVLARAVGGLRSDLKRSTLDARTARLREIDAVRRGLDDARAHYQSPIQMLARESLGSERRSRLMQQIEHSGDAELASLAAFAVSAKDRELGAVLAGRVQRMPHSERPFSPQELADLLVGDEYRSVQAAIMEVDELTQRAILEDRAFENGRASGVGAVQVALMNRDRAAIGADPIQVEEED